MTTYTQISKFYTSCNAKQSNCSCGLDIKRDTQILFYMAILDYNITHQSTCKLVKLNVLRADIFTDCKLSSYRISRTSLLKNYVNDFVRRFIENGLYDKHLEWIRQLNRDVLQVNKYKTTDTDVVVLNIDTVFGIVVLHLVGVFISVVVFVFELKM